jgi:predicted ester cyclase
MVAHGDMVVVRFTGGGTHMGEYQGLLPTGKKTEASGMWMARISNGKIAEAREDYDVLGMMTQLGMELKPIAAKKK